MKFNALLVSAAMMVMTLAACGDDDPVNPDNNQGGNEDTETVEGDVEGTWKANSIILVSGHITVPAGKSLTIEEGVQVIFDDKGVGANHVPVEFTVDGNLYCKGTAENPVLFSVAEENRTKENTFAGLWYRRFEQLRGNVDRPYRYRIYGWPSGGRFSGCGQRCIYGR